MHVDEGDFLEGSECSLGKSKELRLGRKKRGGGEVCEVEDLEVTRQKNVPEFGCGPLVRGLWI